MDNILFGRFIINNNGYYLKIFVETKISIENNVLLSLYAPPWAIFC